MQRREQNCWKTKKGKDRKKTTEKRCKESKQKIKEIGREKGMNAIKRQINSGLGFSWGGGGWTRRNLGRSFL